MLLPERPPVQPKPWLEIFEKLTGRRGPWLEVPKFCGPWLPDVDLDWKSWSKKISDFFQTWTSSWDNHSSGWQLWTNTGSPVPNLAKFGPLLEVMVHVLPDTWQDLDRGWKTSAKSCKLTVRIWTDAGIRGPKISRIFQQYWQDLDYGQSGRFDWSKQFMYWKIFPELRNFPRVFRVTGSKVLEVKLEVTLATFGPLSIWKYCIGPWEAFAGRSSPNLEIFPMLFRWLGQSTGSQTGSHTGDIWKFQSRKSYWKSHLQYCWKFK